MPPDGLWSPQALLHTWSGRLCIFKQAHNTSIRAKAASSWGIAADLTLFQDFQEKKTQKIWKWETVPCVDLRGESGPAAIWWTCGQLSFRKDPWTLALCYFALHSYLDFLSSSVFGYTIHWTFYIETYTIHLANRRQGRKGTSPSFFDPKVHSVIFGASQRKPAPSFGDFGATLISSWIQPMTVCSKDELCKLSCWWWNQLRVWWHEE